MGQMTKRQRILMGLQALLYLGPLMAGLAAQGWVMVPFFAAIFLLWLAVVQPGNWPRGRDEWLQPDKQMSAAAQCAVQMLLVIVLFAIGRGMGGIAGVLPLFHWLFPLALSFVAIPFSRLAGAIPVPALTGAAALDGQLKAAVRVTDTLNALPHDVNHDVIEAHMRAIAGEIGQEALREALLARAKGGEASPTTMRALVNLASSGTWAHGLNLDAAERVFAAISPNAQLAMHFATAMNSQVSADPDMAEHAPSAASLLARADALKGTDAEVPLRSLAARVTRVMQPDAPVEPAA
jgi:hypothetical protein